MNAYLIFSIYLLIINVISFLTMYYDKQQAKKNNDRISEKALFILAILLGGIGIWSGMYRFRHKTKHSKFVIGIPICIVLNLICAYYMIVKFIPLIS